MESNQQPIFADETLLARWLSGDVSEAEKQEVEGHPHFEDWKRLIQATDRFEAPAYQANQSWKQLKAAREKPAPMVKVRSLNSWVAWAAALVGLALISYFLWPTAAGSILQTGTGDQMVQRLPDGSTVRLNAESELNYTVTNKEENRRLNLKGEAFFSVSKGAEFVVETSRGTVQVLGTEFNVYARESDFWVNCLEGSVAVRSDEGEKQEINAGESAYLLPNGRLVRRSNQVLAEPSWWNGQTQFREVNLKDVLAEFSRQYPIEIIYEELPAKKYTGPLPHNEAEAALELISTAMGLSYTFVDDKTVRLNLVAE
ncbi:MAG: FecR domain-containing protein [Bacteroidota bacterium]